MSVQSQVPQSVSQQQGAQSQQQQPQRSESLVEKLQNLLNTMRDWDRRTVVEVGNVVVELVKLPKRTTKRGAEPERLALHLRLKDSFRGVFIENYAELEDIIRALNTKTVHEIAKALDELSKRVVEYSL